LALRTRCEALQQRRLAGAGSNRGAAAQHDGASTARACAQDRARGKAGEDAAGSSPCIEPHGGLLLSRDAASTENGGGGPSLDDGGDSGLRLGLGWRRGFARVPRGVRGAEQGLYRPRGTSGGARGGDRAAADASE